MLGEAKYRDQVLSLLMACAMTSTFIGSIWAQQPYEEDEKIEVSSLQSLVNESDSVQIAEFPENEEAVSIWSIIAIVGGILAALILGFIGFICLPLSPKFQSKVEKDIVIEHIGEAQGTTGKRVLIAYYSRHGTASSIAKRIYDILTEGGRAADLRFLGHIKEDEDLSRYSAFVIGSSVYWAMSDEFKMFVQRYRDILSKHPTAVFACCLTIQRETEKNWERVESYLQSGIGDVPDIKLIDKTAFAGKVEMSKLTLPRESLFVVFLPRHSAKRRRPS